jgi:transposase
VDQVIPVPAGSCPACHLPLHRTAVQAQYQTDVLFVPWVTRFDLESGTCPRCGETFQGRHPEQISDAVGAAGNHLGPTALTMAAELKHLFGVSYRKVSAFFSRYADLKVSPSTLCRAEQRLADLARPTYDLLLDALRRCGVVHADETGWRIGRLNAWLWVFSSATVTIYAIRTSRGHEVPADILGEDFDGYLVVDGLNSYDVLDYLKGRCHGHILRRCRQMQETATPAGRADLGRLIRLLHEAIGLAGRRDTLTAAGYARRVQEIENRLDAWLFRARRRPSAALDRLLDHLCAHRGEWLVFLHEPEVPATNNHAERQLRFAVILRKLGGCNKTLRGALVHSILSSVMMSCAQRGKRFLDLALRLWREGTPQAIPLACLPDG